MVYSGGGVSKFRLLMGGSVKVWFGTRGNTSLPGRLVGVPRHGLAWWLVDLVNFCDEVGIGGGSKNSPIERMV